MSSDMSVLSSIGLVIAVLSGALGLLYSIYKIAKRIDAAIGVDNEGKTVSERIEQVEYQMWPNSGESLADRVNEIEKISKETKAEIKIISELLVALVGQKPVKIRSNRKSA